MKFLLAISFALLSTLMLLSSTGIRISQHWCGDRLVNATIWGDAAPCIHFNAGEKSACPLRGDQVRKKSCCDQRETIVEGGEDDYTGSYFVVPVPVNTAEVIFHDFDLELHFAEPIPQKFHNHSPPLIGPPLYLMVQSFLI